MSGSKRKLHAPHRHGRVGPGKGGTREHRRGRRVDNQYDDLVDRLFENRRWQEARKRRIRKQNSERQSQG